MCARNAFIQAHGFGGRPGSRFKGRSTKAVMAGSRGAAEGGFGRYKVEKVKPGFI